MYKVRLETTEEFNNKLEAMRQLEAMMDGIDMYEVVDIIDRSDKAPDADYTYAASLTLVQKVAAYPEDGFYTLQSTARAERISIVEAQAYYFCNMHLKSEYRDERLFLEMVRMRVGASIPIPAVPTITDGQLKIATDMLIAIDHMHEREQKDKYLIIVVGSTSQSGVSSMAYELIPFMQLSADIEIRLYDPYEITSERTTEYKCHRINRKRHVTYKRIRGYYEYDQTCDLMLDDAYVIGSSINHAQRERLDPKRTYRLMNDYSIKWLPVDNDYFVATGVHSYEQAFITKMGERRATKFPRIYGKYRNFPLGKCTGCIELNYMLYGEYPDRLFFEYLRMHKENCSVIGYRAKSRYRHECCTQTSSSPTNNFVIMCPTHLRRKSIYIVASDMRRANTESLLFRDVTHYTQLTTENIRLHMTRTSAESYYHNYERIYQFQVSLLNEFEIHDIDNNIAYVTTAFQTDTILDIPYVSLEFQHCRVEALLDQYKRKNRFSVIDESTSHIKQLVRTKLEKEKVIDCPEKILRHEVEEELSDFNIITSTPQGIGVESNLEGVTEDEDSDIGDYVLY